MTNNCLFVTINNRGEYIMNESKLQKSGLKLVLCSVFRELYDSDVHFYHSLDQGTYGKFITEKKLTKRDINKIINRMNEIIEADIPIEKLSVDRLEAIRYYDEIGEDEKKRNIEYSYPKIMTFYKMLNEINYFYTEMVESTGDLLKFDLAYLGNNEFVLTDSINKKSFKEFNFKKNIYESFNEYDAWCNTLKINYLCDINKIVAENKIDDFIKQSDIINENKIYEIAYDIKNNNKKIIMLGGPSSSGKTTSTRKLSIFLSTFGLNAIKISLDDYYKEEKDLPINEFGEKDIESPNSLDIKLFEKNIKDLLTGKKVTLPTYDFIKGKKHFDNKGITLTEGDILLIEGLHSLNPKFTKNFKKEDIYKIYVSPFTPLGIDRHNYISTTDNRLIRRMVRDNRTRGRNAEATLAQWTKTRASEDKYIFPFTDEADVVLNTAFVYEMGVLKVFAEPILYSVKQTSPYYEEARRLLNSLSGFFPISSEHITNDNILREFIGGSIYNER